MSIFTGLRRPPEAAPDIAPETTGPETPAPGTAGEAASRPRGRGRRILAGTATAVSCVLVLFALIGPNNFTHLAAPLAYLRIPLEALVLVPPLVFMPPVLRRIAAGLIGLSLGVLAIIKVVDMGFYYVLGRPANLVFDLFFLSAGLDFLRTEIGRGWTNALLVTIGVAAVLMLTGMTLAVLRLTRIAAGHRTPALRTAAVLAVAWVACSVLGLEAVPGVPVAAQAYGRLAQVPRSLKDRAAFLRQADVDKYAKTPGPQLLTGLRGKNVTLAFVESYGRTAVDGPDYAPVIDPLLDEGTARLKAAGFGSRSAFLTSSTYGAGSWLGHSTLLSGLWIDNQMRYSTLVHGSRLTLPRMFKNAGWRTAAYMPGTTTSWNPEQSFYGFEKLYDHSHNGYTGPTFNWHMPPDQYTLAAYQRDVLSVPGHAPTMGEVVLISSHAPWVPTPRLVGWDKAAQSASYRGQLAGSLSPGVVWRDPAKIHAAYRGAIAYTLSSLIGWVKTYGDENTVLVFLGDHQAGRVATGDHANHQVPVTIVAKDPAVLAQISSWGWQDGLRPGATAPVWRMDTFRDRFVGAFSKAPGPGAAASAAPSAAPSASAAAGT